MRCLGASSLVVSLTAAALLPKGDHVSYSQIHKRSNPKTLEKKQQADNLTWYDSYHPYEDHIQYFRDLQAAIPNNSEWVSTGTSYEGRDLYGIHIWGADGPGKPVVLYHATVHAREWIATPVRSHSYASQCMSVELRFSGCRIHHPSIDQRLQRRRQYHPVIRQQLRFLPLSHRQPRR